jgi:hypothetical protein
MNPKDIETWKSYGPWYPTAQLRWRAGQLEQVWRRNFETRHPGGVVMNGDGFDEEWRDVPNADAGGKAVGIETFGAGQAGITNEPKRRV